MSMGATAHLHVAVVVAGVAAVARVHQDGIEAVDHRLTAALGHVGPDVQELGVPHILGGGEQANDRLYLGHP